MDDKLTIIRENQAELVVLVVAGRIDGYWSKVLDESLDELIRSGVLHVALNLSGVQYLSSIGIRVLVKYAKQFRQIQGNFGIVSCSEAVGEVLKMAGLFTVLAFQDVKQPSNELRQEEHHETATYSYSMNRIPATGDMICRCTGEPEKLRTGGYGATDCRTHAFRAKKYGLGLGAIGLNYEDCKNRFGEFAAFGDAVVYAPAGQVGSPDYIIRSGNLIPKIEMLYGILLEGEFSQTLRFTPKDTSNTLAFSTLLSDMGKISGYERFAMVMLAESAGLVGLALNNQEITSAVQAKPLFGFPAIRESMVYTTEPGFANHICLSLGIVCRQDDPVLKEFTRPLKGFPGMNYHFHTAIFNYHPLKAAQITLQDTISRLFNEENLQGVLHLIQDNRPLTGVGESEFKHGVCWLGRINHA